LTWCVLPGGLGVPAVTSIGRNPTFAGKLQTVEVYLLDFEADLYGESLEIQFLQRMRDIIRYPNPEALQDQISLDVQKARQLLLHFRLQDARVVLK
jgi:riboflavin kinase/FMN adenylyltransferase